MATAVSRMAKRRFEVDSDIPTEICDAANPETTPARPTTSATRRSVLWFLRLRQVPITEVGTITAKDVPFATTAGMWNRTTMAGTMTMPPPTPSRPARMPAISPTTRSTTTLPADSSLRPRASVLSRRSRIAVRRRKAAKV